MANRVEELKALKDGLDVLPDISRFAHEGVDAIPAGDLDRLKWYGLFHRKATPGHFMLRLRIPNGVLTSEQLAALAEIANAVGRGAADITTRQNVQLRWITIEDVPWVLQRLAAAGLNSQQSGMDNVRNVVGCPLAGLDGDEVLDSRPLASRLQQAIVGSKRFSNLPRKFNLSITGCRADCAHAVTHDLSFVPAHDDAGSPGFNVLVGGALGGQRPELAQPLDVFVTERDVVPVATGALEVYREHGPRELRKLTRLKVLLAQWGIERFRTTVEEALGSPLTRAGERATVVDASDHIGVTRQRQSGLNVVGVLVPVGRVGADGLAGLGALAAKYGAGEVRLTVQQNVLIPHVPDEAVSELLAEPLLERFSPEPSMWLRSLVTCTGNDFCHFSLIDTKGEALALAARLDERYELDAPVRINMSGCPHACGQHRVGEIGLLGSRIRVDDTIEDGADVFAGARLDGTPSLAAQVAKGVLVADLPEVVAEQVRALRGDDAVRLRDDTMRPHNGSV